MCVRANLGHCLLIGELLLLLQLAVNIRENLPPLSRREFFKLANDLERSHRKRIGGGALESTCSGERPLLRLLNSEF